MTSEIAIPDTNLDDLLNQHFPGKVVRKDLTKLVKEGANVPVYVLEYLLGSYCASNDETVTKPLSPLKFRIGPELTFAEPGCVWLWTAVGSTTTVSLSVKQMKTSPRWSQLSDQNDQ